MIKSWNNSSRIARFVIENRIKETFLDLNGPKEKKQGNTSTDNYPSIDNSDNEYPLIKKNLTDDNYLSKKKKIAHCQNYSENEGKIWRNIELC